MLNQAVLFLLDVLVQPFAALLLLRFHAVWLRVPMRNAIGEFVMALSDFAVLRVRRYVPAIMGLDTASLLLAFVVECLYLAMQLWGQGYPYTVFPLPGLLAWALVKLLVLSIYLLMMMLFVQAVLSWVNPHSPLAPVAASFTQRFLQPVRRIVPMVGNIDFSVLALLIICQLVLIVPVGWLEHLVSRML
ncbi:MAG: YggT family protein [Gallionellaceae bacterium]|nr:MAG: YggT family protein [Gallionellaceae bacterium]